MKNIFKAIEAVTLSVVLLAPSYAANTCQRTDLFCHPTGPSQSQSTPFRVDGSGNVTTAGSITASGTSSITGASTQLSNIILGVGGTGASNASSAANTSLTIPVMVSTNVLQGMAIVATTVNGTNPTLVNGVWSSSSSATNVIGIADAVASSGTVLNVNFSGLTLALTTGTVSVGDVLVSSVTWPGYLVQNNNAAAGAIVGTALTAEASNVSGLTRILVHH